MLIRIVPFVAVAALASSVTPVIPAPAASIPQCQGCTAVEGYSGGSGTGCPSITVDWVVLAQSGICTPNEEPPPECVAQGCVAYASVHVSTTPGQSGVEQCFQATTGFGSGIPQQGPAFCRSLDGELADGDFSQDFELRTACGDQHKVSIEISSCGFSSSYSLWCSACD